MKKTIKDFEKILIEKAVIALSDQVLKDKEMGQVKGGITLGRIPPKDLPWGF